MPPTAPPSTLMKSNQPDIVRPGLHLVSASPRRHELLTRLGIPLEVSPVDADETFTPGRDPVLQAQEIATRKMTLFLSSPPVNKAEWALSADTFIEQDGQLMGKPVNREDAERHLEALSGRKHRVLTGVCLYRKRGDILRSDCVATAVEFRPLSRADIQWYLDTGEWKDAAGSYKIQGAGEALIFSINGAYSNVMGLPLSRVYEMLSALEYPF